MSTPSNDTLGQVLDLYDAGTITGREAANLITNLLEPPTVARVMALLPPELVEAVVRSARGGHVGAWIFFGGTPNPADQGRSRVSVRVQSEWLGGHWQSWPYGPVPLRTSERDELIQWLRDPQPAVRAAAASALAWRGEWDKGLLPLLADDDPLVRGWAGWASVMGGGPTEPVLALLYRERVELRPELAWVLVDGGLRLPQIAEAIVPSLATEARWMAARVLAALGPAALPAREALAFGLADPSFRGTAMEALAGLGEAVVPVIKLLDGLEIEPDDEWAYCKMLAAGSDVPRLIDALDRPARRGAAAHRLACFPSTTVAAALLRVGLDEDLIRALGAMGVHGAPAVPALAALVAAGGRDGEEAARALGTLGEVAAKAAPILARQVWAHVGRRGGRGIAYGMALAELGASAEAECLDALANPATRTEALRILGKFNALSAASAASIAEQLDDSDALVRMYAVVALAKAPGAAESLMRACRDPHREVRADAAKALAWRPYAEAVPALLPLLDDTDTVVRWCAVSAVGALGNVGASARVALSKVLVVDDKAVLMRGHATIAARAAWALGAIGQYAARPVLLGALHDARPDMRMEAATALGRLGGPGVRAALLPLRGDPDTLVRQRVEAVLVRLRNGERWPAPHRDEIAPWADPKQMTGPMRYNSDGA